MQLVLVLETECTRRMISISLRFDKRRDVCVVKLSVPTIALIDVVVCDIVNFKLSRKLCERQV